MAVGKKFDYPPLLAPGRHTMMLKEIETRCVQAFPGNLRRAALYRALEEFVAKFGEVGLACEIWVDGSFLTEKPEPGDVDVTVIMEADVGAALTAPQRALVAQAEGNAFAPDLDTFAFVKFSTDNPLYRDAHADAAYTWGEQYQLECGDQWLKGFAVLRLRETDVGLRLHS